MERLNDEELIYLFLQGSETAFEILLRQYQYLLKKVLAGYYSNLLKRVEEEDLLQDAMYTFMFIIYRYRSDSSAAFRTFARVCVEKRWKTRYTYIQKDKQKVNYEAISMDRQILLSSKWTNEVCLKDILQDKNKMNDPQESLYIYEKMNNVVQTIRESHLEQAENITYLKMLGFSNAEIAGKLNLSQKKVANTVYRIRKKLDFNKH